MSLSFSNKEGVTIPIRIINNLINEKDTLSELDSFVGDGDHGINLAKGMTLAKKKISVANDTMSSGFEKIAHALENEVGGSLGPLFGFFFEAMSSESKDHQAIDGQVIYDMMTAAAEQVAYLTEAKVGDKNIVDVLFPAVDAYKESWEQTQITQSALTAMGRSAQEGLKATANMLAAYGRGHRLGEKVIGHQDSGATTMNMIFQTFISEVEKLVA